MSERSVLRKRLPGFARCSLSWGQRASQNLPPHSEIRRTLTIERMWRLERDDGNDLL
jgi:hypothetical protein